MGLGEHGENNGKVEWSRKLEGILSLFLAVLQKAVAARIASSWHIAAALLWLLMAAHLTQIRFSI
jgi:hypothetical protein